MLNFTEICPLGAALMHADGRRDGCNRRHENLLKNKNARYEHKNLNKVARTQFLRPMTFHTRYKTGQTHRCDWGSSVCWKNDTSLELSDTWPCNGWQLNTCDLGNLRYVWLSFSGTFLPTAKLSGRQAATLTNGTQEDTNNSMLGYITIQNLTLFNARTEGNVNFSLFWTWMYLTDRLSTDFQLACNHGNWM